MDHISFRIRDETIMKKALFLIATLFLAIIIFFQIYTHQQNVYGKKRIRQIYAQNHILREGDELARAGDYEGALTKFSEAMEVEYILKPTDRSEPIFRKVRTYRIMGRYADALHGLDEFMELAARPGGDVEIRNELSALTEYQKSGSSETVYKYIEWLRLRETNYLPPQNYNTSSPYYIAIILRLYDVIGDCDSGIKFVNEVTAFFRTGNAGDPKAGWVDDEYLKIREAFEKDKAEGTKGRATKAIIQSD